MNVVIIGYRGTGKGKIGKALAKRIGFGFLSVDDGIEEREGTTILKMFEQFGEEHFRDIETEALKEACCKENLVVATGGGAPMREENAKAIKENNVVILLECSPKVSYSRIKAEPKRPVLTDLKDQLEEIKFMLEKRNPTYRALADFTTDTTTKEVEENVDEIVSFLESKKII